MDWPSVPLESIATDLQAGFACQPTDDLGGIPQLSASIRSRRPVVSEIGSTVMRSSTG